MPPPHTGGCTPLLSSATQSRIAKVMAAVSDFLICIVKYVAVSSRSIRTMEVVRRDTNATGRW